MNNIDENNFNEILKRIQDARRKVIQTANTTLIELYWHIGEFICQKVAAEKWGKGVVKDLADFIATKEPGIKGFGDKNLWRMKQFYETYCNNEKLATLWGVLSWSHNRRIMSLKTEEEREFYLRLCVQNNCSVRELERIIDTSTFERAMLADNKSSEVLKDLPQNTAGVFRDTYILDFLNLPTPYKEKDLQKALVHYLKEFIQELGVGFSFVGEDYRLQVGTDDFYVDLLFFHRQLQSLVAFELKTTKFKPKDLGQLEFYLESLDRDVKLSHENPSIGVLLCREKNDEVVEYALSRSVSPSIVAEYQTKILPKKLLKQKLNDFYDLIEQQQAEMKDEE